MPTFLPTQVYKKARENHMQGKEGKIVTSWNQFAGNLKEAVQTYSDNKQAEFYAFIEKLPRLIWERVPLKHTALAFSPYLLYLLIYSHYNLLRALTGMEETNKPNFTFLPWIEQVLFRGFPHRFLAQFANPAFDIMAAIPYLIHFPLPAFFLLYLITGERRRRNIFTFMWCAGWVNICALTIQFLFPTAPPWFVDSAVFDSHGHFINSGPNEAGFHRLDTLIGARFFHGIYSASPLKFGAFPSLHVAWPTIILVNKPWVSRNFARLHVAWISWAAMYSNHHYLIDVIAGLLLPCIVNLCMLKIWNPFGEKSTRTFALPSALRMRTPGDDLVTRNA